MVGQTGVPESRVFNRFVQDRELDKFKKSLIAKGRVLKDSKGNTVLNANTGEPIFLSDVDSRGNPTESVADRSNELARLYGPTFGQVMSDVGYGLSSIAKGLAEKGSPLISLIRGIFSPSSGIETVVPKPDPFSSGADATGGAFVGPTFDDQKININRLDSVFPPSEMDNETFQKEVLDYLYPQVKYEPIRISDMDMSGVMASNVGQNIIGDLQNLRNLANQYNLDKIQFDPFRPNRIGYKDQFMFNNTPINYNVGIGDKGIEGGISFAFKNGGPVDKHGGLGYKLK